MDIFWTKNSQAPDLQDFEVVGQLQHWEPYSQEWQPPVWCYGYDVEETQTSNITHFMDLVVDWGHNHDLNFTIIDFTSIRDVHCVVCALDPKTDLMHIFHLMDWEIM